MGIASGGYVPFLSEAETLGAAALWVHTHPGEHAEPTPSSHDREVDFQIADLFRLRSGNSCYGTLIVSPRPAGMAFTGYLEFDNAARIPFTRLWEVGGRFRLHHPFAFDPDEVSLDFDRNIRAFGGAVQTALGDLRVGIVGCGGTGSAVAEQLARLGVRRMVLIDPDELSSSNVTRVYGSTPADVGQPKVDVIAGHLKRITPNMHVDALRSTINLEGTALRLTSSDVVFGCTDDNAGRLVLSRFASYLLTPVIDCGVLLSSDESGSLLGIDGRVTTLVPGQACLVCRNRIDLQRAATELLTPEERVRLQNEGYAPALGRVEPAVITFTSLVAASAVSELLERLIGYGPNPQPSEVLLRCHDREISTNRASPRDGHYCDSAAEKRGLGVTIPFLEQTWPA
jgi:molybdopterin/thiamine biosynthesis adenylyltransferase